jgi:hypothetical protein
MPGQSSKNQWQFGKESVRGLALVDFAANEKGNPISLLTRVGIARKWIIAVDVGYSSVRYNTWAAQFSRIFFPRALLRDFTAKYGVLSEGWSVYEMDAELSGNNSGQIFSADVIGKLIQEWEEVYEAKNKK